MRNLLLALIFSSIASTGFAQEDRLSYPELEVAPRASERVRLEALKERKGRWLVHLPIQTSALLTMVAANQAKMDGNPTADQKRSFDNRRETATYVGGAWLVSTAILAGAYRPYTSGFHELRGMKTSTQREELTRERIAEEILHRPATIAKTMTWLSVGSQVLVNMMLLKNADDRSAAVAGIAALGAMAPVVFRHPWIENSENHKLYKKRIYGPISGPVLLQEDDAQYAVGYGLHFSF